MKWFEGAKHRTRDRWAWSALWVRYTYIWLQHDAWASRELNTHYLKYVKTISLTKELKLLNRFLSVLMLKIILQFYSDFHPSIYTRTTYLVYSSQDFSYFFQIWNENPGCLWYEPCKKHLQNLEIKIGQKLW